MEDCQSYRHRIIDMIIDGDAVVILHQRHPGGCATEKKLRAAHPDFLEHLQKHLDFCLKQ